MDRPATIKEAAQIVFKRLSAMPSEQFWAEVDKASKTEEAISLARFLEQCDGDHISDVNEMVKE